jgi:hypothetical protein
VHGAPGSGELGRCDPAALVAYLSANRAAARAWVGALNADPTLRWSGGSSVSVEQIPAYVAELSTVVLQDDERVTNHQFVGGTAVSVQSVLQRGTAVLVDAAGVARVRCACGNPLTPLRPITAPPRYHGTPWSGFTPIHVTVDITVINIDAGPRCGRYEYYDGDGCRPLVECPEPQYLGMDGRCYYEADPCPENWLRDNDGRCYDPYPEEYCRNGYVKRPDVPCDDGVRVCPDGSPREDSEACESKRVCPDRTTLREDGGCRPNDEKECPGGAQPDEEGLCPAPPISDCEGAAADSPDCRLERGCPPGAVVQGTACPPGEIPPGVPPGNPGLVPADPPVIPPGDPSVVPPGDPSVVPPVAPPVVQPPVVESPVVQPPVVQPPVVESPAVEPPAVEPTATEPPAVDPPVVPQTCPPGMFLDNGVCFACVGPSPDRAPPEGCGPTAQGRRAPRRTRRPAA